MRMNSYCIHVKSDPKTQKTNRFLKWSAKQLLSCVAFPQIEHFLNDKNSAVIGGLRARGASSCLCSGSWGVSGTTGRPL